MYFIFLITNGNYNAYSLGAFNNSSNYCSQKKTTHPTILLLQFLCGTFFIVVIIIRSKLANLLPTNLLLGTHNFFISLTETKVAGVEQRLCSLFLHRNWRVVSSRALWNWRVYSLNYAHFPMKILESYNFEKIKSWTPVIMDSFYWRLKNLILESDKINYNL